MKLKTVQQHYHDELGALYSKAEIDCFFFMLTCAYYSIKRIDLAMAPDTTVESVDVLHDALQQLKAQKPIQYILGKTEFYGLPIKVNVHTLIPRPETEELVDWIVTEHTKKNELKILDVGTGSGCIPIALAKHLPEASVFSLDVSKEAIKMAKRNAELNDVNLKFIEGDVLTLERDAFVAEFGTFDLIVSNPPYVRQQEKTMMQPNVLDYEPHLALFVTDEKPLRFYDAISDLAASALNKDGILFFEINEFLGEETRTLLQTKAFKKVEVKQDAYGKDRMVKAAY